MSLRIGSVIVVVVAPLAACRPGCEPPRATGGTAEERAAAEEEAEHFLGELRDEVCVAKVRLGSLRGSSTGKYTPTTRRIKVEKDRALTHIRSTVRHEVCHALQFQQELDLSGPEWALALPVDVPADERAGETWAYTCQQGPEPAYLMGEACPDDPFGTVVFERIRSEFHPPSSVVEGGVSFEEVGRSYVGEGEASWGPSGTEALWIEIDGARTAVELSTGTEVDDTDTDPGPAQVGDARLLYYSAFAANGARGLRLVYEDERGRTRAGCLRPQETPFAADGALWSAYRDGDEVVWGRWVAR